MSPQDVGSGVSPKDVGSGNIFGPQIGPTVAAGIMAAELNAAISVPPRRLIPRMSALVVFQIPQRGPTVAVGIIAPARNATTSVPPDASAQDAVSSCVSEPLRAKHTLG